jgi:nitrous oxidase accessory protein NosD
MRYARVDHNELRENAFGVALVDSADVSVTRNEVSGSSQAGIFASLGADVSVRGNRVTRSESAIVYDSSDGDIRFNRIEQAADAAIALFSGHDVEVGFNYVRESGVGVQLLEADGNSLQHNLIEGSIRDGILLDASDDNLIDRNLSRANGADGVHVMSPSSANRIRQNQLRRNAGLDCHDDTVGAGTAGTAILDPQSRRRRRPARAVPCVASPVELTRLPSLLPGRVLSLANDTPSFVRSLARIR